MTVGGQTLFLRTVLQQKKNAKKINNREFVELKRINIFHRTQLKPIQDRLRRLQKSRTIKAMDEINKVYGVLAKRLNQFFDPKNKGRFPFAGQEGRLPIRFNVPGRYPNTQQFFLEEIPTR